jgi:hypothetical protein
MALVSVDLSGSTVNMEAAAEVLGVKVDDLDQEYGLVPLDLQTPLFGVRVRADRLIDKRPGFRGPFADPPISPFGR